MGKRGVVCRGGWLGLLGGVPDPPPKKQLSRRQVLPLAVAGGGLLALGWLGYSWLRFPSDRTPEGAYLRVVSAVNRDRPEALFAYLETSAQHACYSVGKYRRRAYARVLEAYPEPERGELSARYRAFAGAADGEDVFAIYARSEAWLDRLRRDLSGVAQVEEVGPRASVETVRGTRYAFRRGSNGIWGLTLFTAPLVAEEQKAARDLEVIERAADDYLRARSRSGDAG